MNIIVRDGTITVKNESFCASWPLYMEIPSSVKDTLSKDVFKKLKLTGDPKNMPDSVLNTAAEIDIELCDCKVTVDNIEVDPSNIPTKAKTVCDIVYAFDNGIYEEVWNLRQLKDIPDKPETEKKDVIEIINGIPTVVERDVEINIVKSEEIIGKDGNGTGKFMQVSSPVIIKGKKVSQKDKDRLAVLESKVASL